MRIPQVGRKGKGVHRLIGYSQYHFRFKMIKWQNGFLSVSKAAALGWARGPGKRSERRSRPKAICPNAMRSFQNELHHFVI